MKSAATLVKVAECLYRNTHGTYFALLKVRGKQIKRSLKTEDSALARRRLTELRGKAHALASEGTGMTFEALASRWLAMKRSDLRPRSWTRLDSIIRTVQPFFAGLPVRSIGLSQIEAWKIKRGAAVSARTFNYERDVLRQLFEYARESIRIILDNPAQSIKKRKVGKREVVIPSKEQFRELLVALRKDTRAHMAANLVEFLGYSGLRLGEATTVLWRDVNFKSGTLLVTGGKAGTKNHEVRTIPLFPPLQRLLEGLVLSYGRGVVHSRATESSHGGVSANSETTAALSGNATGCGQLAVGRVFPLESAKTAIHTACKKAGLPRFGHHAMRHFFCSNAIEAGCDFKVIAGWLGHKDGGVLVARTYGHLRNEHSAAMAKRMTFDVESL